VAYAADELNAALPDDLIASTEERVAVESEGGGERLVGPDVRIFEPPADAAFAVAAPPGVAVDAPLRLLVQVEPIVERFIKVIDAGTERLITVIEFVSPTNKTGVGLQQFRAKRAELVASGVNFLEIDLVRAGDWRGLLAPHRCPPRSVTTYRATARVPDDPAAAYLYPIPLRSPLPDIKVPLRRDDPEVKLALQPLVDRAYANGRYARRLDYNRPCDPPLAGEDAAWADELLRKAGRRTGGLGA
jgi:hypothetical protein